MIRLVSTPTNQAITRLEHCRHRAEQLRGLGQELPPSIANCYRHETVKASILAETGEKCAYCESKMRAVHWGDVDHLLPKGTFPELALTYDNLTLSCAICNNGKRKYYSETAPILNPYEDAPEEHLVAVGPLLWHRNGSAKGERTIALLNLNREGLNERRLECIKRLSALGDKYINEPEGPLKNVLAAEMREYVGDGAEFAFAARAFLRATYNIEWDSI